VPLLTEDRETAIENATALSTFALRFEAIRTGLRRKLGCFRTGSDIDLAQDLLNRSPQRCGFMTFRRLAKLKPADGTGCPQSVYPSASDDWVGKWLNA
jgi:hypothetical protein